MSRTTFLLNARDKFKSGKALVAGNLAQILRTEKIIQGT